MWLFFCYLLGLGTSVDTSLACENLYRAAKAGGPLAKVYLGRAIETFKPPSLTNLKLETIHDWLLRGIQTGCVGARDDFERIIMRQLGKGPELASVQRNYAKAYGMLRNHYGGVGATHFVDSQGCRLNILSIDNQRQFEREITRKAKEPGFDINAFTVNSRADRLIHFASACGFSEALAFVIRCFKTSININVTNEDGETALVSASRAGQAESVRTLLENGADLTPSNFGESPLHWIPLFDSEFIPELAARMVRCGVPASIPDDTNCKKRVLHQKAQERTWTQFWDSNYPAGTPLHRAVHFNNLTAVNSLLEMGADPEEPGCDEHGKIDYSEVTPSALQLACLRHHYPVVEVMLKNMKTPKVHNVLDPALLHIALSTYNNLSPFSFVGSNMLVDLYKTVLTIMQHGADPGVVCCGIRGSTAVCTALFEAVQSRSMDCVSIALQPGLLTSPDLLNVRCGEEDMTALGLAVEMGLLQVVQVLLKEGADAKMTYGRGFRSVLHSCANMASSSPHTIEIFHLLVPYFNGVDQSHDGYETPFIQAVRLLKFDLALALLDKGASINFEFSKGDRDILLKEPTTILGVLLQQRTQGAVAALKFLLGFDGKGIKKKDWRYPLPLALQNREHGMTMFHAIAFRRPSPLNSVGIIREMMSLVIEAFGISMINQQAKSSPRPTALHIAAFTSNIEVVAALLKHGAIIDIVDDDGFKPIDRARDRQKEDIKIDVEIGWTNTAVKEEQERRLKIYQMLV
jgi:ankyrin repeat protein